MTVGCSKGKMGCVFSKKRRRQQRAIAAHELYVQEKKSRERRPDETELEHARRLHADPNSTTPERQKALDYLPTPSTKGTIQWACQGVHFYCFEHGSMCHGCYGITDCDADKFTIVVCTTGERLARKARAEKFAGVAKRLDFSDLAPGVRHTRNSLPPPIPGKVRETRHSLPARLLAGETDAISTSLPVSSISTPILAQETDATPPPVPTNGKELAAVARTVPIELPYVPGATYTVSFDHNGNLQVSVVKPISV